MQLASESPENLLLALYRLAHRQQENFTTEAFAHLVQHLVSAESEIAARILDWLSDSTFFSELKPGATLAVRTQYRTDGFGIPDVRISADATEVEDSVEVIIEVKLDTGLTAAQAQSYVDLLERSPARRKALVALLGGPPMEPLPLGVRARTWGELGSRLRQEKDQAVSDVTRHLIEQFVGLLNHLNLIPLRVRSGLSAAVQAHTEWAKAHPNEPSLYSGRIKSIAALQGMPHLEPLVQLLLQIEQVLQQVPGITYSLDSSPSMSQPWIGFNIDHMAYFLFVWVNEPERICLERYRGGVDRASFDGTCGYVRAASSRQPERWWVELDLADEEPAYFECDELAQRGVIEAFFRRAYEYGQRLRPAKLAEGATDVDDALG